MEVELGSRSSSDNANIRLVPCGGKLCGKFEELEDEQDACTWRARGRWADEERGGEGATSMAWKAMILKV